MTKIVHGVHAGRDNRSRKTPVKKKLQKKMNSMFTHTSSHFQ